MTLLGKAPGLRRHFHSTLSMSRSRQNSINSRCHVFSLYPSSSSLAGGYNAAAVSTCFSTVPAGGKSVSEFSHRHGRSTENPNRAAWSAWEVAGMTVLAGAASLGMIASTSPRTAQNEPATETATAHHHHHLPAGRPTVSFVQRTPNRMHNLVLENQQSAEQTSFRETIQVQQGQRFGTTTSDVGRPYDISVRAIKGNRVTMEDEYFVTNGGRFAAVFDGHGGGGVSTWLRSQLYGQICRYLKETHWEQQRDDKDSRKPSLSAYVSAIRKAFNQVEADVVDQENLAYQGSTAVAVLMHESEEGHRTLISANVGDSRAILSRRGKAIDLTRDHKPNEEREKARILKMGEVIEWDSLSKVHRVRNLSLSRAIGDRHAKPVVSPQVEIKLFPVAEDGDEFFLLASDGLWDVMNSQEVVSYVHQRFEKELGREQVQTIEEKENMKLVLRRNMARAVAREALRRGTGDNICVVIVWMQDLKESMKE